MIKWLRSSDLSSQSFINLTQNYALFPRKGKVSEHPYIMKSIQENYRIIIGF